jgi:hypothetical protein
LYSEDKSRELVLYGTTAERMQPIYSRIHRLSIYEPATIHDFPFEVLENCLKYLSPLDLVAPSLACRAWRPAATGLIYNCVSFKKDLERSERLICGLHLRNIVFGAGSCNIKRLDIRLRNIKGEYIPLIIRLVAPTLSSLYINFHGSLNHYETLDNFLSQCARKRNLHLNRFNFGRDSPTISPSIKEGFARLIQLDLIRCRGDVSMFVDRTPIPNLQSLNTGRIEHQAKSFLLW